MTTRILPADEWGRLVETDLPATLRYVRPEDVQVVVVEDEGCIVAAWAAMRVTHLEGVWIAPKYRGRAGVARRLLRATLTAARTWGASWAMTGAQTPDVAHLLTAHLKAVEITMQTFVVPLESQSCQ